MHSSKFEQNGVVTLRYSEDLQLLENLMPIHLHDNDGNTSVNSMEALNKNIEKFIEIDYFT